jgi:uncharacterized protein YndB with AHSA1/START domain
MATATVTPDQDAVIAEVFIAAPPARVFQAISDPSQMPLWWGQKGMYRVTNSNLDVKIGGKWRSEGVGEDGKTFYVEGEYLEVDPPRRLVHTWTGSYSGPLKTRVQWDLEPKEVHGLHPGVPKNPGRERWCGCARMDSKGSRKLRPATGMAGSVCSAG